MFELLFAALVILAAAVYFVRRRQKLKRMALRDQVDDMFSGLD